MELRGSHARYHPGLGVESGAFVEAAGTLQDKRIAISTGLGSVFSPLAEEAHRKLIVEREGVGLILPEALPGKDPFKINLSDPNVIYENLGLRKYSGVEFVRSDVAYRYKHEKEVGIRSKDTFDIDHPIGPYGEAFTLAMVNTMRAFYSVIPEQMSLSSRRARMAHKDLLDKYTFLLQPKYSLADSLKSTGEAFTFLTNDGLKPGFEENPVGLFRRLIETGAFEELSRMLLFSELATLTRDGFSPKGILDPNTLEIDPDVKKVFLELRSNKAQSSSNEFQTFKGCPLGYKNTPAVDEYKNPHIIKESGVNFGARIFVEYLDHYYQEALRQQGEIT